MNNRNFNNDERGQTALETAIILIAFIVVATVFAFTILSAGSASTEKGEEAIYAGLEGVQSSMSIKGAIIAQSAGGAGATVDELVFTVALASGGEPVNVTDTAVVAPATEASNVVVIGYRDDNQFLNELDWAVAWVGTNDGDNLLEDGELAEITVDLSGLTTALAVNTAFTVEVKPPTGAILSINRTTPAAMEKVMELR